MFCTLTQLGIVKVQGKDAKKFLQGQLTCDVEALAPLQSSMGAHCTPQGRVISLFYLFYYEEAYYLLMQKSMLSIALDTLKKYAVFFKIEIQDDSAHWFIAGSSTSVTRVEELMISVPLSTTSARCFILSKKDHSAWMLEELAKQNSMDPLSSWHYQNIEEKIPSIYPSTSGKFLAHELNLDKLDAINFNKGCYTGQEIIARMHYRAKLKTRLYKATLKRNAALSVGMDIYSSDSANPCGMIVDLHQEGEKHSLLITLNESSHAAAIFIHDDIQNFLTISEK